MQRENPQALLLRMAAFLVDAFSILLLLITPASVLSWLCVSVWNYPDAIGRIWHITSGLFVLGMLFRDVYKGASMGKRVLGLRIVGVDDSSCGPLRRILRNVPIIIPGWNLVESLMLLFTARSVRSGDLLTRTRVVEE
jgi:uncharacterized RDD family membrane protein YckC